MIALAGEDTSIATVVGLEGILQADVGARAGLDAVVAGELRHLEQIGVIEDEALGILVRQPVLLDRSLASDDLADRLDDMRATARVGHPWIGDGHAAECKTSGERGFLERRSVVEGIKEVADLIGVAAQLRE